MEDELKTARDEHLAVPDELLGWLVAGTFYNQSINDQVTLQCMEHQLNKRWGKKVYAIHRNGSRDHTSVLVDPENTEAVEFVGCLYDALENQGCLDEDLHAELTADRIQEEWEGQSFGQRLVTILDADEDLSLAMAFAERPCGQLCEHIEQDVLDAYC